MKNQNTQTTFANGAKLSESGKSLILTDELGNKMIVNVNLAKFHLEVPFTRKDGVQVSVEQIKAKKVLAAEKLAAKINKTQVA